VNRPEEFKKILSPKLNYFADKKRRLTLILPDIIAKVALFDFEKLPSKKEEITDLVKWKIEKMLPFSTDEAKIFFRKLSSIDGAGGKTALLVSVLRKSVLEQYDGIFRDFEFNTGLIDLSSFNLVNLCGLLYPEMVNDSANYLILNVAEDYYTINIFRRGKLVFYRAKTARDTGAVTEDTFIRAIEKDFMPTLLYFRDRLRGGDIKKVLLRNHHFHEGLLKTFIEERYEMPVAHIDPGAIVKPQADSKIDYSDLQKMAPLIGAILAR